ncbi:hypothetical protein JCGZ_15123 [Jatropha curcas]|uniref:Aminoacyl-tRNA synthetase class II (D/K/N) domain-containing protein n=1 Tax=Jatropha curcas TaxID=180498 RepID=A0A067LDI0_JATCU|nr:asparagine--tRNA ligase, cytoplasmic 2 [Jatropha curcas]KDP45258.1 hypothetical protein JCGZ_15123 [Jatropha curcas]
MASQEPTILSEKSKTEAQEPKTTPQEQKTTSQEAGDSQLPLIPPFKYSKRVVLKTILERDDGGVGLAGERVVIGGWVKSFKEVKKDSLPSSLAEGHESDIVSPGHKDVSCMEILQTRLPLIRSIAKIFGGGGSNPIRAKLEPQQPVTSIPKPALSSIVNLLVSDGSCVATLQVIIELSEGFPIRSLPIGTCILAEGVLKVLSTVGKRGIEFKAEKIHHIGTIEEDKYPLSRKRLPLETLRDCSHFRPRTTTVASVMRIRSALTFATYTFFQNNGFLSVQVPIITITDGEGFSEKFRVTTLSGTEVKKEYPKITTDDTEGVSFETVKAALKEKNTLVQQLKRSDSNREALLAAEEDLLKITQLASLIEAKRKLKSETLSKASEVHVPEDFFSQQTYLTVSGLLHLESYASALGNVYAFGPRFRADRRGSAKQLPEMWIVEAEIAFSQLEDAMNCAEDYFKFLCKWVLENCSEDMKFISKRIDKNRINLLEAMSRCAYERITYMEAVNILKKVTDRKFDIQPEWDAPLTSQHLSCLTDEIYSRKPVIIYNYPKGLKPFYARLNDDGQTVAAFDMIIPKGGILITGTQNEERFNMLNTRINELGLAREQYEWYLDLRRHGTVKTSGFSAWFDLLVLFATAIPDVRDAIPFPRSSGKVNN